MSASPLDKLRETFPLRLRSWGVDGQLDLLGAEPLDGPRSGMRLKLRLASFEEGRFRDMRAQTVDLPYEEGASLADLEAYLEAVPSWAMVLANAGELEMRLPADFLIQPYERETPEVPARGLKVDDYIKAIEHAAVAHLRQRKAAIERVSESAAGKLLGQETTIRTGPFAGRPARVLDVVPPGRLRVQMTAFGQESAVDLPPEEVTGEPSVAPAIDRIEDLFINALGLREAVPAAVHADYQTHAELLRRHLARPDPQDARRSDLSAAVRELEEAALALRTHRRLALLMTHDPLKRLDECAQWMREAIFRMTGDRKTRNPVRVILHRVQVIGTTDLRVYGDPPGDKLARDQALGDGYFSAAQPYQLPEPFYRFDDLYTLRIWDDRPEDPMARWINFHLMCARYFRLLQRAAERLRDAGAFEHLNDGKPLHHYAAFVGQPHHFRLLSP